MDGGIYDNQGIDAALLAIKRYKKEIKMFIISDTDKKNNNIFTYPQKTNTLSLSLNALNRILLAFIALSVISSVGLLYVLWFSLEHTAEWLLAFLIYGFPAVILGLLAYGIYWLRHKIKTEVLRRIPKLHLAAWNEIKHLTIDQVIDMAALRVTSLFALAGTIFMKRIRSLVFAHVYEDERYEHKRVSNLIYELDGTKDYKALWLKPTEKIQDITRTAASMPTTLWFDNPLDLQKLIACGEYSICYNLIDYILRLEGARKLKYPEWFERAVEDWKKFERDPMMMVEGRILSEEKRKR
jgi:hypothetical protein